MDLENASQRNTVLMRWVNRLGPVKQTIYEIDSASAKIFPDYAWINAETMGVKLSKKLETIKNAQRPKQNFYELGYESKNEKKNIMVRNGRNEGFRLSALFRYWNAVQYLFPYQKPYWGGLESGVTGIYSEVLSLSNLNSNIGRVISELVARIHDSHASTIDFWNLCSI